MVGWETTEHRFLRFSSKLVTRNIQKSIFHDVGISWQVTWRQNVFKLAPGCPKFPQNWSLPWYMVPPKIKYKSRRSDNWTVETWKYRNLQVWTLKITDIGLVEIASTWMVCHLVTRMIPWYQWIINVRIYHDTLVIHGLSMDNTYIIRWQSMD